MTLLRDSNLFIYSQMLISIYSTNYECPNNPHNHVRGFLVFCSTGGAFLGFVPGTTGPVATLGACIPKISLKSPMLTQPTFWLEWQDFIFFGSFPIDGQLEPLPSHWFSKFMIPIDSQILELQRILCKLRSSHSFGLKPFRQPAVCWNSDPLPPFLPLILKGRSWRDCPEVDV